MGAPTNAANVKKVLANSEPSTHGGKADMACALHMSLLTQSGHQLRNELSPSHCGPTRCQARTTPRALFRVYV